MTKALINSFDPHQDALDASLFQEMTGANCAFLTFPQKLMVIITIPGNSSILSWDQFGERFTIHNKRAFLTELAPKHLRTISKEFRGFVRKMKRWGFSYCGVSSTFYHKNFIRSEPMRCSLITTLGEERRIEKGSSNPVGLITAQNDELVDANEAKTPNLHEKKTNNKVFVIPSNTTRKVNKRPRSKRCDYSFTDSGDQRNMSGSKYHSDLKENLSPLEAQTTSENSQEEHCAERDSTNFTNLSQISPKDTSVLLTPRNWLVRSDVNGKYEEKISEQESHNSFNSKKFKPGCRLTETQCKVPSFKEELSQKSSPYNSSRSYYVSWLRQKFGPRVTPEALRLNSNFRKPHDGDLLIRQLFAESQIREIERDLSTRLYFNSSLQNPQRLLNELWTSAASQLFFLNTRASEFGGSNPHN